MKYYTGGHIGDTIYQLYSIMKAGGGTLYVGPHNHGAWGIQHWMALLPLLKEQWYLYDVKIIGDINDKPTDLTYDFSKTWEHLRIAEHFESDGRDEGDVSLKKREYLNCFRERTSFSHLLCSFSHHERWLYAPSTKSVDIVIHAPKHKLTRSQQHFGDVVQKLAKHGFKTVFIGSDDALEWSAYGEVVVTPDLLVAADYINSARLFFGTASCCYVIAEALGKLRFVDIFGGARGTTPRDESGWETNSWSVDLIVERALMLLR